MNSLVGKQKSLKVADKKTTIGGGTAWAECLTVV